MKFSALGDKMKAHENEYRIYLPKKNWIIGRIDGRAFHTWTKGLLRPWDPEFSNCMASATIELCRTTAGCKLGYYQSDEISILISDLDREESQPWFDYNLQKLCSVGASVVTAAFCEAALDSLPRHIRNKGFPSFDARFFVILEDEIKDYFMWRIADAERNSVSSLAQAHFSHRDLQGKNGLEMKQMLANKDIYWDEEEEAFRVGQFVRRFQINHNNTLRNIWTICTRPDFSEVINGN